MPKHPRYHRNPAGEKLLPYGELLQRYKDALADLRRTRELAFTDSLTLGLNRAGFQHVLAYELDLRARGETGYPLFLIIGDVNGLKQTNDRYGHRRGDTLLANVGEALRHATGVRGGDVVRLIGTQLDRQTVRGAPSRYGGDEVAVVGMGDFFAGAVVGTRIQSRLRELEAAPETGISLGLAYAPEGRKTDFPLFDAADEAMYASKEAARRGDPAVMHYYDLERGEIVPFRAGPHASAHQKASA